MELFLKHLETFIYATQHTFLRTESEAVKSELNVLNRVLNDVYNRLAPILPDIEENESEVENEDN